MTWVEIVTGKKEKVSKAVLFDVVEGGGGAGGQREWRGGGPEREGGEVAAGAEVGSCDALGLPLRLTALDPLGGRGVEGAGLGVVER